jgi:hypothetical protein
MGNQLMLLVILLGLATLFVTESQGCPNTTDCGTCIADKVCIFCLSDKTCIPGNPGGPIDGATCTNSEFVYDQCSLTVTGKTLLYIGIGVGGGILLVIIILICWCCHKRSKKRERKLLDDFEKSFEEKPKDRESSSKWEKRKYEIQAKYGLVDDEENQ